jgi:GDP/UDP-N,N'-diacetylbacillosamine 2-epimerase (hydrolysing)
MRVAVLTSSRADFGIYLPLLKKLKADSFFDLSIIAFGTHVSKFHGYTLDQIEQSGFEVSYTIESLLLGDSAEANSTATALTAIKFASFWAANQSKFDLVFCLGDRYEMFAAVMAGVPFGIPFGHIHAGEKTLGAIDNIYRHSISHASIMHFTATQLSYERVKQLVDVSSHVYHVGALSLDNLGEIPLLDIPAFKDKWGMDLSIPTILITFHPETVEHTKNKQFVIELISAIHELLKDFQVLITMPNADTEGNIIRDGFLNGLDNSDSVLVVENLGTQSYFTAMANASMLLGNTSSGIIEAASFGKYVINLGRRQEGREHGDNVIDEPIDKVSIVTAVNKIRNAEVLVNNNIYYNGGASGKIIQILKAEYTK